MSALPKDLQVALLPVPACPPCLPPPHEYLLCPPYLQVDSSPACPSSRASAIHLASCQPAACSWPLSHLPTYLSNYQAACLPHACPSKPPISFRHTLHLARPLRSRWTEPAPSANHLLTYPSSWCK
eukprot:6175381-Pleurochrysis_carterae.AAC.1